MEVKDIDRRPLEVSVGRPKKLVITPRSAKAEWHALDVYVAIKEMLRFSFGGKDDDFMAKLCLLEGELNHPSLDCSPPVVGNGQRRRPEVTDPHDSVLRGPDEGRVVPVLRRSRPHGFAASSS